MARKCTICEHKKRNDIDISLAVDGASLRDIAGQFRVSKSALKRHMDNGHISAAAITVKQIRAVHQIDTFQEEHAKIRADLEDQKNAARAEENLRLVLDITKEQIRLHDINGKAAGVYREKVDHSVSVKAGAMTDAEIEREIRDIISGSTK